MATGDGVNTEASTECAMPSDHDGYWHITQPYVWQEHTAHVIIGGVVIEDGLRIDANNHNRHTIDRPQTHTVFLPIME